MTVEPIGSERKKILVVEDNALIGNFLYKSLQGFGYDVPIIAVNGEQALQMVQAYHPDLVLMDIGLPGERDGVQVASEILTQIDIPVVFLTEHDDAESFERVKMVGSYGYLVKPIDKRNLQAAIEMAFYRHKLERKLKESEERNRIIFTNNYAPILLVDPVTTRIVNANRAACKFYGYSLQEMKGKSIIDIDTSPADQVFYDLTRASQGLCSHFFFQHIQMTGSIADVEVYCGPMRLQDQIILYMIVHDVTERRRAEITLQLQKEELEALNAVIHTLVQSVGLEQRLHAALQQIVQILNVAGGWIQLSNDQDNQFVLAAQVGIPAESLKSDDSLPVDGEVMGFMAHMTQPIVFEENWQTHPLMPIFPIREKLAVLVVAPLRSRDRVWGILGLFNPVPSAFKDRDVQFLMTIGHEIGASVETARLAADAAEVEILQELNRLRFDLIANVSHELRTPLGLIKLFTSTLLRKDVTFDRETQLELLSDIDQEADNLAEIVDNLLDLSQQDSQPHRLNIQRIDLSHLIQDIVETFRVQCIDGHHLECVFPQRPLWASADPKKIEQVIKNLISNAIKYSPNGGSITIRGAGDEWQILVEVSDQGIGIPSTEKERIFERFYRVDQEQVRRTRGAGLGLALCRSIVEAHGGRIWVESQDGAGSTFYFSLPVRDQQKWHGGEDEYRQAQQDTDRRR